MQERRWTTFFSILYEHSPIVPHMLTIETLTCQYDVP